MFGVTRDPAQPDPTPPTGGDYDDRDALPDGPARRRRGAGLRAFCIMTGRWYRRPACTFSGNPYRPEACTTVNKDAKRSNPGNRFEQHRVHILGDELDRQEAERYHEDGDGRPINIPLKVLPDHTKKVINRVNPTSDVPFDWTLNPYRGCEHGCLYLSILPQQVARLRSRVG